MIFQGADNLTFPHHRCHCRVKFRSFFGTGLVAGNNAGGLNSKEKDTGAVSTENIRAGRLRLRKASENKTTIAAEQQPQQEVRIP